MEKEKTRLEQTVSEEKQKAEDDTELTHKTLGNIFYGLKGQFINYNFFWYVVTLLSIKKGFFLELGRKLSGLVQVAEEDWVDKIKTWSLVYSEL